MNRILILIFIVLFTTGCKEKRETKKRTLSDYFDDKDDLIAKTPNSSEKAEFVLDFYDGMNKQSFDSLIQRLEEENLIEIDADESINLIVENKESVYGRDSFELKTNFENDSLKSMSCYLIQGYFPRYSSSPYLDEYKSLFSDKYGTPKLSFFSEYIPTSLTREVNTTRTSYTQYYFWIKDNLCVQLSESGSSDEDSKKERRTLFITYSTLKFQKEIQKRSRLKEELELEQEKQKEIQELNRKRKEDSLKREIF